ncbi:anthranilate 1,2-dioxygenase system ferredoxin--NAD(+) reductase [Burkholderia pseudomultivorans]|uniref:Anthranilate 1,2-dioxygenase system ferredoxin--NAD(+) reductase component n=1 Tax=Burkholderia pseudomultivorans TaxID=1207504 RepID=A0ABU2E0X8_9BURK|nr:anthranilate 1,2-dioxygenase system ferredoxin--NAD(+) reductase [Burkholderia pseudomultivorans]MDR8726651.1 Anthranilate 1,2-dioxygenase system ferredoxin--NAD(+) reductase component [Burkholderia pseudomultivorans]MDR8734414.1 Anthranilate 1,2-dioxygenase system ferredoxin--NAD(+) reductase component [Burkholderia pseudomultivorans]MDR8742384.1 Anthranilate 1,2-dioxygenase system ferredoxin--NAD(+) reductase component [Burkholderia pseudomultivorans]MDR8753517.1 Anthranilate 1,2-dioxygena
MSADPFVIVGAGHAARRTAEALRERDADARIVMIGAERELPYDRPALSKDALLSDDGERRAFVRDAGWYDAQRIELRLGTRVDAIERAAQRVRLDDGATLPYARLVLATGSRVRTFGGPIDAGVAPHYVRTVDDARALRAQLAPGRRVAVLGGGFIGLEVAAAARQLGCDVTVIDPAARLLQRALPEVVGAFARQLHDARGVAFRLATLPRAIRRAAAGGAIVETDRGDVPADIVVVGIGVVPNVELAQSAGLDVDNGIRVDAGCRTNDSAIFATGEVTMHFNPLLGRHVRIESWQVAENQPAVAAANALGADDAYAELPWLWSDQYDCNLQMLGLFGGERTIVVRGNPASGPFTAFGLGDDGRIVAVASANLGRDIGASRRLIAAGAVPDPVQLADPAVNLKTFL